MCMVLRSEWISARLPDTTCRVSCFPPNRRTAPQTRGTMVRCVGGLRGRRRGCLGSLLGRLLVLVIGDVAVCFEELVELGDEDTRLSV
ncbi:hypothetical protein BDW71DRAFT_174957 [Aspergillus fruticulosus]